ncbi:hypothetical protein DSECCO2_148030 [anaerobic digester metagenome]
MKDLNRADRLVKKQVLSLNRHIPKQRKTLEELLKEDRPHVVGSDGTRHRFKASELQKIADIVPESEHHLLKLPIYVEIESVTSGARITGNIETKVVCSILNMEGCSKEIFIYRPDIKTLRAKFPTTTQYIFLVR